MGQAVQVLWKEELEMGWWWWIGWCEWPALPPGAMCCPVLCCCRGPCLCLWLYCSQYLCWLVCGLFYHQRPWGCLWSGTATWVHVDVRGPCWASYTSCWSREGWLRYWLVPVIWTVIVLEGELAPPFKDKLTPEELLRAKESWWARERWFWPRAGWGEVSKYRPALTNSATTYQAQI